MKDFIELIKENAKKYPNQLAVIDGDRKITYRDFLILVKNISSKLYQTKETPKVAFDLNQSIESYALIIAILNIGGIYCPLNVDAPTYRKKQILNEFQPDIFIVEDYNNSIQCMDTKLITIGDLLSNSALEEIVVEYDQNNVIYVIYTSGSTGMPKGVMIRRKSLNKFLEWSIPTYGANSNDIWGQFSLLSFDLSIVDVFTCLCSTATLFVMADPASKLRPSRCIETNRITVWHSIPSAVEFMIKSEMTREADISSLRLMSFCGELLRKHHLDFLFRKNKDLIIFNTYGPTEGTLFCTCQEVDNDDYKQYCDSTISIGDPIPGWNLLLNSLENTPDKEIVIYGEYIGKGYLGDVSNSKYKIIEMGGRKEFAFETGDLVIEKEGKLYFSCRKDRQLKIKGNRIEPDEIDYFINEYLHKTSITIAKDGFLYSFIESEEIVNEIRLREFLKQKLEAYKIPNRIILVQKIPRNSNLKVNIKELMDLIP